MPRTEPHAHRRLAAPAPRPLPRKSTTRGRRASTLRAGDEIKEPKKLKNVSPSYPEDAIRAGLEGVVIIDCVVDVKGKVDSAKVLRGVPPLTDAALKAVRQWRYTPTLLNGAAVPVIMTVTVNFRREPQFQLKDLLDSLKSANEFIRESAANRLRGGPRRGLGVDGSDIAQIQRELERLAKSDPSERVQTASRRSLDHLEGGQ